MMIRVILPFHLRNLAQVGSEVTLEVEAPATLRSVLDALEARYPMLRELSATTTRNSAGPSCASSPAKKTSPTSRPTPRSPMPSPPGRSRLLSLARLRAG